MDEVTKIRERQRNEEQLRLQSAALQAAANAIMITDRSGKIVWVNPAFVQHTGYSLERVRGKTPRLLKSGKHDRAFYQEMWETILSGKVWHNTIINRHKDGTLKHEDLTITPIPDSLGAITHFVGIKQDISERIQAERDLRESEEKFRALADHSIQGIVLLEEGRTTFVNQAFCEITGFSIEESLSQTMEQRFESIHPDDRDRVINRQLRFERGEPIDEVEEVRIRRKDGAMRWVLASNKSFTLQGKPTRLGIIVDITERKQAEEKLQAANQRLQQTLLELQAKQDALTGMTQQLWQASKLATVGELTASIAHELNNPLATVSLKLETLAAQLNDDADKLRAVEVVADEVERMGKLVGNLLQFSRRTHQQISTVNVSEEIDKSLELVEYHLRSNKIQLNRNFVDDVPTVQADRQQLRQVFLNLLTNATDAMKDGGMLTVSVTRANDGATPRVIRVEFIDSGAGIEPANLEKIWDPFFTTKPEGKGTGLGLAICRRVIEEHHGSIAIESEMGSGTKITIDLPATNGEDESKAAPSYASTRNV